MIPREILLAGPQRCTEIPDLLARSGIGFVSSSVLPVTHCPAKGALRLAAIGAVSRCGNPAVAPCLDGHQFQRPSNATVEGTSSVLTRKASMRIPIAIEARMLR